jgi:hypothetical protein
MKARAPGAPGHPRSDRKPRNVVKIRESEVRIHRAAGKMGNRRAPKMTSQTSAAACWQTKVLLRELAFVMCLSGYVGRSAASMPTSDKAVPCRYTFKRRRVKYDEPNRSSVSR